MMELSKQLAEYATREPRIQAVLLLGSRSRKDHPADVYSDYDFLLLTTDSRYFLETDDWLKQFGTIHISFLEPTLSGGMERRVCFDGAQDADFLLFPADRAAELARDPEVGRLLSRGYRVPVDKIAFAAMLSNLPIPGPAILSEAEFQNLVQTFAFHILWAVKKVRRGELWCAKQCIDGYMKQLLRQMLECREKAGHGDSFDCWHDGRFLDQWLDKNFAARLPETFAKYEAADLIRALSSTAELFAAAAKEAAAKRHFRYPAESMGYAMRQFQLIVEDRHTVSLSSQHPGLNANPEKIETSGE